MSSVIDRYDAAFFDLDGVIYLGDVAVPGAVEVMAELTAVGTKVVYVTNNAARSAETVVDHLRDLGFEASLDTVLTSAQVAVRVIAAELAPGARVLVAGTRHLADLVAEAGLLPVASADDDPVAVVQGYDPQMTWPRLDEVALAIQRGATWYATNNDTSRPTERGLVPGAGGAIAVIAGTVGGEPRIFGKPFLPMITEAIRRSGASRPLFVGDRIDTDIVGAANAGIDSLMVFTGAHGKSDLVQAGPGERPTHIGADLHALLEPARVVRMDARSAACGDEVAMLEDDRVILMTTPTSLTRQLDALWAIAHLSWANPPVTTFDVLARLDLLR